MSAYHWKDGWQFQRGDDGQVVIWRTSAGGTVSIDASIPADEWVSIVTHLGSDKWELAELHKAAHEIHLGFPPPSGPPEPLK